MGHNCAREEDDSNTVRVDVLVPVRRSPPTPRIMLPTRQKLGFLQ